MTCATGPNLEPVESNVHNLHNRFLHSWHVGLVNCR